MNFFSRIMPHLSFALSVALIVVAILNSRNPAMGFLLSTPGLVLSLLAGICGLVCALQLIVRNRKKTGREE